jgi:hypothetical protein
LPTHGSNLLEVGTVAPTTNRAGFTKEDNRLNTTSRFSKKTIIIPELTSISQSAVATKEENKEK